MLCCFYDFSCEFVFWFREGWSSRPIWSWKWNVTSKGWVLTCLELNLGEHASPGHQVIPPIGCCLRLMVYLNVNRKLVKKQKKKRIRDEPLNISICKWVMSSRNCRGRKGSTSWFGWAALLHVQFGGTPWPKDTHTTFRTVCFSMDTVLPDHTFRHMRARCLCQGTLGVLSTLPCSKTYPCMAATWVLSHFFNLFCLFALCHDASLQIRKALIFASRYLNLQNIHEQNTFSQNGEFRINLDLVFRVNSDLFFRCSAFSLPLPIGSMGLVYLPTWMVDFYGFHVGKYTIVPWIRHGFITSLKIKTVHLKIIQCPKGTSFFSPNLHFVWASETLKKS